MGIKGGDRVDADDSPGHSTGTVWLWLKNIQTIDNVIAQMFPVDNLLNVYVGQSKTFA
jgi:hypothetical protein